VAPVGHRSCGVLAVYLLLVLTQLAPGIALEDHSAPYVLVALLALGPSMIILCTFYLRFRLSTTKRQTFITLVEGFAWIGPGLFLQALFSEGLKELTGGMQTCNHGMPRTCSAAAVEVFRALVRSFFIQGLFEESVKYIAVRRILFKDRVVDSGCLTVYSIAASVGCAAYHVVTYMLGAMRAPVVTLSDVVVGQLVTAIPLHLATGVMIGIGLGKRKFLGMADPFYKTLLLPILFHGTMDLLPFLCCSQGWTMEGLWVGRSLTLLALICCRYAWLKLENVSLVDVRALERAGLVSAPLSCCVECDCLGPIAEEDDPPCPTTPFECPDCGGQVRAHVSCTSYCPHCGDELPEVPPSRPLREDISTGISTDSQSPPAGSLQSVSFSQSVELPCTGSS